MGIRDMAALKEDLFRILKGEGAALMGVADMSGMPQYGLPVGVSVGVPVPGHIVRDLETAPTREYLDCYHSLNSKLNGIVAAGAEFLESKGYRAVANTTHAVKRDECDCTPMPHKTVATRAGLGWIGRSCVLVTEKYGGSVRISSLFTDAPLPCDPAVTESKCPPDCRICVDSCPGHALTGEAWRAGMEREALFDRGKCVPAMKERMLRGAGVEFDICGLCFAVCPYTQRRLRAEEAR